MPDTLLVRNVSSALTWQSYVPFVTAMVALLGGVLIFYLNAQAKRKDDRRSAYLQRLDRQLRELYGPLYAWFEIGDKQWRAFLNVYAPPGKPPSFLGFFPTPDVEFTQPDPERLRVFRLWTEAVFLQTNVAMEQAIVGHADLLVGSSLPDEFIRFCVHVASLRASIADWSEETFDRARPEGHMAIFGHPAGDLHRLVKASFEVLKEEQSLLLKSHDTQPADEHVLNDRILKRVKKLAEANQAATVTPASGPVASTGPVPAV